MNYIKGSYRKTIYKKNNYIIGLFKVRETNDESLNDYVNKTLTFTGYFLELNEDDNYFFYGELINHPKYGVQYQVNDYERVKPEDKSGIIDFLSSDLFPGVGIKLATKIVEELGLNAIDVILKDKDTLKLVPKISNKKIDAIYNILYTYENSHQTIVDITNMGLPLKDALDIYNKYKNDTLNIINNNIYEIIDSLDIDFIKIDRLRKKVNISDLDPRRIKSGIVYVIKRLCYQNGDIYVNNIEILNALNNYLNISITLEELDEYLNEIVENNKIINIKGNYYLNNLYSSEELIAKKIVTLASKNIDTVKHLEKYIYTLEEFN